MRISNNYVVAILCGSLGSIYHAMVVLTFPAMRSNKDCTYISSLFHSELQGTWFRINIFANGSSLAEKTKQIKTKNVVPTRISGLRAPL